MVLQVIVENIPDIMLPWVPQWLEMLLIDLTHRCPGCLLVG